MSPARRDHAAERALAVAALAGALAGSWPVREGLDGLDWRWLVPRVRALGIAARLWAELARAGLDGEVPGPARAALQAEAHQTAADAALRGAAASQVGALLDAAGVPWLPIKGAALAVVAPEYAATRRAIDVDLVVPPDDLERAGRVLAAALPLAGERRDYDGAARDVEAAMRDGVQHLYAFEAVGGIAVELHHAFPGLTRREITDGILSRAHRVDGRGGAVRVPALDDLLGTACVHAHLVHPGERGTALRHLADVAELVARGASAELARERYDRDGRTTVAASLRELERARDQARAPGGARAEASRVLEPGAAGRLRGWAGRVRHRSADIAVGLRRHGLGALVPPRSFMVAQYGQAAAGPRLPLLHLRRWGAIILRTVRGR